MTTRTKTDSLGSIEIDADRCWGSQTERTRLRAVGLQKEATADVNLRLADW